MYCPFEYNFAIVEMLLKSCVNLGVIQSINQHCVSRYIYVCLLQD